MIKDWLCLPPPAANGSGRFPGGAGWDWISSSHGVLVLCSPKQSKGQLSYTNRDFHLWRVPVPPPTAAAQTRGMIEWQESGGCGVSCQHHKLCSVLLLLHSCPPFLPSLGRVSPEVCLPSFQLSALVLENKPWGLCPRGSTDDSIRQVPRYEWLRTGLRSTWLRLSIRNVRQCILGGRQPPRADGSLRDSGFVPLLECPCLRPKRLEY